MKQWEENNLGSKDRTRSLVITVDPPRGQWRQLHLSEADHSIITSFSKERQHTELRLMQHSFLQPRPRPKRLSRTAPLRGTAIPNWPISLTQAQTQRITKVTSEPISRNTILWRWSTNPIKTMEANKQENGLETAATLRTRELTWPGKD